MRGLQQRKFTSSLFSVRGKGSEKFYIALLLAIRLVLRYRSLLQNACVAAAWCVWLIIGYHLPILLLAQVGFRWRFTAFAFQVTQLTYYERKRCVCCWSQPCRASFHVGRSLLSSASGNGLSAFIITTRSHSWPISAADFMRSFVKPTKFCEHFPH